NVTERRDVVTVTEISFQHVAFYIGKPIRDAELPYNSFRGRNHFRPILRRHLHPWRLLGERDSPNSGTRGDIEHAHFRLRIGKLEVLTKRQRAGITHWDNV